VSRSWWPGPAGCTGADQIVARTGQGRAWLDFVATADPVPNGPLIDDPSNDVLQTFDVANRGFSITDHTTYWRNADGFVASIACALGAFSDCGLDDLLEWDGERLSIACCRRRWRVAWLMAARLLLIFTVAVILGT
jgi:hypothetical protein